MALIPQQTHTTVNAIYGWYEQEAKKEGGHRPHLGASEIGNKCERALWYKFRHTYSVEFPGRILRLFQRGHAEEHTFIRELQGVGLEVISVDKEGNQYRFQEKANSHFQGSMDSAVKGFLEAPSTWHVVDYKTSNDRIFKQLQKDGVEKTNFKYYAQLQMYMHWSGMTRAAQLVVNKNTDELYFERIKYNAQVVKQLIDKAERVVFNPTPLAKISERPDWWECKFCDAYKLCHEKKVPSVNCRTCCHATPTKEGNWLCENHGHILESGDQKNACEDHLFIPDLLDAELLNGDTDEGWVQYKKSNGVEFVNSKLDYPQAYSSHEIEASFEMIGDAGVELLKENFDATVVG